MFPEYLKGKLEFSRGKFIVNLDNGDYFHPNSEEQEKLESLYGDKLDSLDSVIVYSRLYIPLTGKYRGNKVYRVLFPEDIIELRDRIRELNSKLDKILNSRDIVYLNLKNNQNRSQENFPIVAKFNKITNLYNPYVISLETADLISLKGPYSQKLSNKDFRLMRSRMLEEGYSSAEGEPIEFELELDTPLFKGIPEDRLSFTITEFDFKQSLDRPDSKSIQILGSVSNIIKYFKLRSF